MTVEQLGQKPVWIEFFGASGSGKTTLVKSIPSSAFVKGVLGSGSSTKVVRVYADIPRWTKFWRVVSLVVVDTAILKIVLEIFCSLKRLGLQRRRAQSFVTQYLYLRSWDGPGRAAPGTVYLCDQGYIQLIASALSSCPGPRDPDHFFQELPPSLYFSHIVEVVPMYLRRNEPTESPPLRGGLPSESGGVSDPVCLRLAGDLGLAMVTSLVDVISQFRDPTSLRFNPLFDL